MELAPLLWQRFFDSNGNPLAGGKLYSYQAGTTTPQATYTDQGGLTANANPVVLDADGYAAVWLNPSLSYKFVLKTSADVTLKTTDGVVGTLTPDSVATSSIADGAVTTPKLASDSVTTVKIGDDQVTAAKLKDSASTDGDRAVTADHIRNGAIGVIKLADAAIANPRNVGITATVATNALTIALKTAAGADASATDPIKIPFRNATLTTGTPVVRSAVAATSLVISSGSTLGQTSGNTHYVYVYAIDNGGTVELAASSTVVDESVVNSTTAEGGTGTADLSTTLYSTTARTNVATRLIGRIKVNEATAGTWATAPTEITLMPFDSRPRHRAGTTALQSEVGLSASCGNFSSAATSPTDVTNLSVTITTTGRPVRVALISAATTNASSILDTGNISYLSIASSGFGNVMFLRDGTNISTTTVFSSTERAVSSFETTDTAATAGSHTYKLQVNTNNASYAVAVNNAKLIAYEI